MLEAHGPGSGAGQFEFDTTLAGKGWLWVDIVQAVS
jgi:hypothetical protein